MEEKSKLEWLKFLSNTHRTEFNERRKHEWKTLLSLITFYILCAASVLSGKFKIPSSPLILILLTWAVFLFAAVIAVHFLLDLHSANNINKEIANKSENAIVDILNGDSPETSRKTLIPDDNRKKELQIGWCDLVKSRGQKNGKPKLGMWACRAQVLILLLFAFAGAFVVTVTMVSEYDVVQRIVGWLQLFFLNFLPDLI